MALRWAPGSFPFLTSFRFDHSVVKCWVVERTMISFWFSTELNVICLIRLSLIYLSSSINVRCYLFWRVCSQSVRLSLCSYALFWVENMVDSLRVFRGECSLRCSDWLMFSSDCQLGNLYSLSARHRQYRSEDCGQWCSQRPWTNKRKKERKKKKMKLLLGCSSQNTLSRLEAISRQQHTLYTLTKLRII